MHKLPTNLLVICDWTSSLFQTKKSPPWTQSTKQNQSGFRPKRSTEDALLYMTTKWRKAINSGKVIRILFINFKKFRAHQILLKKLRSIRRLLFLPWELSPRPQAEYHRAISNIADVDYGVTHWLVLPAFLFMSMICRKSWITTFINLLIIPHSMIVVIQRTM